MKNRSAWTTFFVFLLIFQYFRVDPRYQHRLLFWGVLGALVMRGAMIGAGAVLIQRFEWILYLFGAFLLYAGFKLFGADHAVHPEKNPVVRWAQKILPMSQTGAGQKLFVREDGRWLATPLFLVVIVLETTDLVFAVDSIPAVFGVTRDPFLVYTSNVCAILGLRAFYFLLAGILPYFRYLDEGLAIVLMFIGAKMLAEPWVHISTGLSLAIVGGVIAIAVADFHHCSECERTPAREILHRDRDVVRTNPPPTPEHMHDLADQTAEQRAQVAQSLFTSGTGTDVRIGSTEWKRIEEFRGLVVQEQFVRPNGEKDSAPRTDGWHRRLAGNISKRFAPPTALRRSPTRLPTRTSSNSSLNFHESSMPDVRAWIFLRRKRRAEDGAIARFLEKFGEGIQQVGNRRDRRGPRDTKSCARGSNSSRFIPRRAPEQTARA